MNQILRDRKLVLALAGVLVFIILLVAGLQILSSAKRELKLAKEQQKEMAALKDEFMALRQRVDAVESKKGLSNVTGIVQAVDEVFRSVGVRNKVKAVKATGQKEVKEGFQEEAEVTVEKVTMNEMVNIFYRIENAPMVLTIRKASVKKSFDNPDLLNINLVLSFLKKK